MTSVKGKKGDVFGDPLYKEAATQCTASVRCLTYCDLHIISRDYLTQVLNFHQGFAQSFSRNLVFTCNLRQRFIFRKKADVKKENELKERDKMQSEAEKAQSQPLRRLLVSRLRKHNSGKFESNILVPSTVAENVSLISNNESSNDVSIRKETNFNILAKMTKLNQSKNDGKKNENGDEITQRAKHEGRLKDVLQEEVTKDTQNEKKNKVENVIAENAELNKSEDVETKNLEDNFPTKEQPPTEEREADVQMWGPINTSPTTVDDQKHLITILTELKNDINNKKIDLMKKMSETEQNIEFALLALNASFLS
ncbi:hypothetical protein HELRODRAFT_162327 [Helobdella robusta]|uniref:Cyclic nucleotide-binding domain-containing protein n=1 Tax=Helobdella robusta TaxID=6412 RepID=T1ESI4_HELRO|nr:hypothetical protein HELRODRAFT_162327 [Helobdella robusta]ESN98866.1 hypothetical protein HELRODRAFT_162327 [Helobdella robusta]